MPDTLVMDGQDVNVDIYNSKNAPSAQSNLSPSTIMDGDDVNIHRVETSGDESASQCSSGIVAAANMDGKETLENDTVDYDFLRRWVAGS